MSRIARIAVAGVPYHVTQRGNGRQRVFFDDTDYALYLDLLREQTGKSKLTVWAWCLMPNHVHLIVVPQRPASMARALGRTHAEYARHFNLRQRSCGHVWQARFFSCPLDDAHLWQAMAYVERNPVRAGLAGRTQEYRWSSAEAHLTGRDGEALLDLGGWAREYDPQRWRQVLETSVDEEAFGQRIQEASVRGRPLGSEVFVKRLESLAERRLRPLPVGRPKTNQEDRAHQLSLGNGI